MAEKIIDIKINAKEAQKELDSLDKEIQQLEDNVSDFNRELIKLEKQLLATSKGSKQREDLNKKIAKTRNLIKKETLALKNNNKQKTRLNKGTQQLNKKLKEQAKQHNEVAKGLTKSIGGTSALDRATGGLFSSFQGLTSGLTAAIRSLGFFKVALISTGVGALIVAIGSLTAAFTSSEEGQNRLTKALNRAKAVMSNVISVATELGNNLLNIGSSIKNFFTGDGGLEDIGNAITNTYENVSDRVKTLGDDIKEDIKAADKLSDDIAKADKIDRKLKVERQKANVRINDLRTKAYNTEKFNNEERIKFLEEAIRIEDGITNKEIEAARLRFEAKKAENDMVAEVRKEDLDEQADLEAKLANLDAKKINRQREVANQRQMILRKEKAEQEKIERDAAKTEEQRLKELEEKKLEQQELAAEIEEERLRNIEENAQREIEAKRQVAQAEEVIRLQNIDNIAKGFSLLSQLAGDNKKLQALALIGESAAGIARTIIETQTANAAATAQGAALAIPTAGASVATAAALVTSNNISAGLGIASNIAATAKGLQALGGGGSPPSASQGGTSNTQKSQAPSINVVGAAPENQLAQALGEQEQKPVKAFVVSSDVSTAQSLDRNIIDNASIG